MREDVREANVVLAKCRKSHRMYGIRIERRMNNVWYCTWAFPISETCLRYVCVVTLVVGCFAVLVDVETFFFDT